MSRATTTKPFAKMTATELVRAVKRLLERDDLSDKAAATAALVAITVWEEARSAARTARTAVSEPSAESGEFVK